MGRLAVNGLAPNFRVCDQRVGAASISQSAADAIAALGPQYCSRRWRYYPEAPVLILRGFLAPTGAMVNSQGLPAPGPRSHSGPRG